MPPVALVMGGAIDSPPNSLDSDDEGHSIVLTPEVPEGLEGKARLAAEDCPEICISLVEDE